MCFLWDTLRHFSGDEAFLDHDPDLHPDPDLSSESEAATEGNDIRSGYGTVVRGEADDGDAGEIGNDNENDNDNDNASVRASARHAVDRAKSKL